MTIPEDCTTTTSSSVVDEYTIFNKSMVSSFMPVNSTTIGTCNITFKVYIIESSVVTVTMGTVLQVYRSTTTTIIISVIELGLITNESTIINSTVYTGPYDCTTITNVAVFIDESSFCSIVGEVGTYDYTVMTTPEYSTTITTCSVVGKYRVIYTTFI